MYGFEEMIDMGIKGSEWTSPDHRAVAVNTCICNPMVKTMDDLASNVAIINAIPSEKIRTITGYELIEAGCYI